MQVRRGYADFILYLDNKRRSSFIIELKKDIMLEEAIQQIKDKKKITQDKNRLWEYPGIARVRRIR